MKTTRLISVRRLAIRVYLVLFYNFNFLINLNIVLGVSIPYWLFLAFRGSLSASTLISELAILVVSTLAYNVVYVINDTFDDKKDVAESRHKNNATTYLGIRNYPYLYAVILGLSLLAIRMYFSVAYIATYCALLAAIGLAHTMLLDLKPKTFYVLRLLRFVAPAALFYLSLHSAQAAYLVLVLLLAYPILVGPSYIGYLTDNRQFEFTAARREATRNDAILIAVALVYALTSPQKPLTDLGFYVFAAIFAAYQFATIKLSRRLSTSIRSTALRAISTRAGNTDHYDIKRGIIASGLINLTGLIAICIYVYTH